MPSLRVNDLEIAFTDAGEGPDVVLFLHGHPFDRSMWRPQADFCAARGWRAIAPDLRGYGASEAGQGPARLEAFCSDFVALLDVLEIEKVVIAGLSMGGPNLAPSSGSGVGIAPMPVSGIDKLRRSSDAKQPFPHLRSTAAMGQIRP